MTTEHPTSRFAAHLAHPTDRATGDCVDRGTGHCVDGANGDCVDGAIDRHRDNGPVPALVRALTAARRLRRSHRSRHRSRYRARRVRRTEPAGARSFRTSLALARALAEPEHAAGRRRLVTALEPTTQEERPR